MYLHGLDLGQANDFTAHVIDEARVQPPVIPGQLRRALDGRMIHRLAHAERYRGVAYPEIVRRVCRRIGQVEALDRERNRVPQEHVLVVDRTGVGAPVVDLFREAERRGQLPVDRLTAVQITGGVAAGFGNGFTTCPKRDLVFAVARVSQEGRLRISSRLTAAKLIEAELRAFRVKLTPSGNDTFESARERDHDDLVLATALAVWVGELAAAAAPGGEVEISWR